MSVEVTLIDTYNGKELIIPTIVKGTADYDFVDPDSTRDISFINPAGARTSVLQFSLGQLDSPQDARDASLTPLHARLAKKIISGINNLF